MHHSFYVTFPAESQACHLRLMIYWFKLGSFNDTFPQRLM